VISSTRQELLIAETRPAPFFVGDDLALDFLNSVGAPWGTDIEWLSDGRDLLEWLRQAQAVPEDVLARAHDCWGAGAVDVAAAQARELREWFRDFARDHAGGAVGPDAEQVLAPLNLLLQKDDAYRQIERRPPDGRVVADQRDGLRWRGERRWREPGSLLMPIVQAMGSLLCDKDFTLVRSCEGPTCTMWFHDVSKAHARRWCSMAVCGNRAKAAAHRARTHPSKPARALRATTRP